MQGFVARPETGADGALNLMIWQCTLPGKTGVCLSSLHSPTCLIVGFIIIHAKALEVWLFEEGIVAGRFR